MRDDAFALGKPTCADLADAYVLYLSITLECAEAARSAAGISSHMASILSNSSTDSQRRRAASFVVQYSARNVE